MNDAQSKAQELKSGFLELEETIKAEQQREQQFTEVSKEITKLTHGISKNNTRVSDINDDKGSGTGNSETYLQLANRNTENEKLEEFRTNYKKHMKIWLRKRRRFLTMILPMVF